MNDIDFPAWIATSPTLALAAVLGRSLQQTYCPTAQEHFTVGFRGRSPGRGEDGDAAAGSNTLTDEHRRTKLMLRAVKGDTEGPSSSSSSSSGDDSTSDADSDGGDSRNGVSAGGGRGRRTANNDEEDEDEFYSVASYSSVSGYDPLERPRLQKRGGADGEEGRRRGPHARVGAGGNGFALGGFGATAGAPTLWEAEGNGSAPPIVDILHDPRVQRLFRLSGIDELCASWGGGDRPSQAPPQGPQTVTAKQATGVVALFALAVECRGLPSDVTKGFYTECGSLFTTLLAMLRDGVSFCTGVDVEGFTASLVACGLKMRSSTEEDTLQTPRSGTLNAGGGSSGRGTPRSRNVGLSGFDPRVIDAAIVDCIPEDIDTCAGHAIALGTLQGLAGTFSKRPVYLSPPLVHYLHSLTDAFATSPKRRELAFKKLLSLLLEAMSCSLVIDYSRANNWITAIIQETYVVRGLFQKEILHARVVAATLTLLIRQYQEMAAEYAATCGSVEGMPDFSEGDQLIELVWRALQDVQQGWGGGGGDSNNNKGGSDANADAAAAPPRKPQTLYGANLRVVLESVLRTEVERLRCFHVITCASAAYQQRVLALYATAGGAPPPPLTSPVTTASPTAGAAIAGSAVGLGGGVGTPLVPMDFPLQGKQRTSKQQKTGESGRSQALDGSGRGYALCLPSDEEEVLRVRVMSNIVRFLLLPTSVLNVLPRGETTRMLRADLVRQCAQVLTLVSATEFAQRATNATAMGCGSAAGGEGGDVGHPHTTVSLASLPSASQPRAGTSLPAAAMDSSHHEKVKVNQTSGNGGGGPILFGSATQLARFSNGYYRSVQGIVHELIRVLVKGDLIEGGERSRQGRLPASVIHAVEGSAAAAEVCLQSLCASDALIRSFAVSEVIDAVVRVSAEEPRAAAAAAATATATATATAAASPSSPLSSSASDAAKAKNLAPCFDILCSIIVPRQYSLTRAVPRRELSRYAQLLCDTYADSLRGCLRQRVASAGAAAAPLPTAVMRVVAQACWRLVTRMHERLSVIACDAVRLSRLHQQVIRSGRAQQMSKATKRAAARERARYVHLLNSENASIRELILTFMRCMLGVAWPGSGVLYQHTAPATASSWSGEQPPSSATEPGAMAASAITCIDPFLKPLSLLLALSTLFPIRSLRNKGLAAHADYARFLTLENYREQYLFHYSYRPTTKADEGEQVNANTVEDADALLDSSESRPYLSEFRSLWLLLTYYGFSCEALGVASAARRKLDTSTRFYEGERRLSDEQAAVIRHIAAAAAPLLQMRSSDMHQSVADIVSLERYMGSRPPAGSSSGGAKAKRRGGSDGVFDSASVKRHLQRAMKQMCGGSGAHWEKLSAEELFLMRSLLDLEMLRASSGSIANLTLYLHFEVREFVASPAIKLVVQHVVSAACALYLDTLKTFLPKNAYQLVSKDIHQLVLLLSFSLASVRSGALTVLNMIIAAFPAFAAYSSGLQLLWAVINTLESGTAAQVEGFCRRMHFNAVPAVAVDPTSDDRKEQVQALVQLAERWAETARRAAPLVLFQAATKFVVGQSVLGAAGVASTPSGSGGFTAATQLSGSRLAVKAAAEQTTREVALHDDGPAAAATGVLAVGVTTAPNYAQTLIKFSNAQGQVLSAVRVSAFASVEKTVLGLLRSTMLASMQSSRYRDVLIHAGSEAAAHQQAFLLVRHRSKGDDNSTRENGASRLYEADSLLCSSVALLTTGYTTPSGTVDLLRFITQGPIRVFDSNYIRAAVDGWSWLLANDRERFMVPLLEHVADGIQWTIAQGLGLFDGARPSQRGEVQTGEGHGNESSNDGAGSGSDAGNPHEARRARLMRLYPSDYASSSPHRLLIAFLANTYVDPGSPWALDPDVLLALYKLASAMVQYPSRLSLKDASFAETMRLAVLVGHICRHLHMANTRRQKTGEMVVVAYTSIAALRRQWYACLLQWFRKTPPSWYFASSPALAKDEMSVLEALVRLLREEENVLNRAALGFIDFSAGVTKNGSSSAAAEAPVNIWGVPSAVRSRLEAIRQGSGGEKVDRESAMGHLVKQEQRHVTELLRLLRVLVQHELVRLRVWQTPRRTLRIANPLAELTSSDWTDLVDAAARHAPAVMVAMASRFPGYPAVKTACVAHVVHAPERFAAVPEAVDLYITEDVLAAGAPKLFLFANCTIVQALRYLDSSYAKYPQVSSYAIRSLLSQKSEYLIFYLPQLLQVLAADASGRIQDFLQRMSEKSVMFCHQLLWCLQTEGEGDGALSRKCKALAARIKDSFDDEQRAFYKGEFDYTALVTSLSGELMSVEKPQRKPKLRLRLQDAEFHDPTREQHLYLPTDSDYRIVGVIPRTAGAMQSAAKCPILVQFQCVRRDAEDTRTPDQIAAAERDSDADEDDDDDDAGDGEREDEGKKGQGTAAAPPVVKACIFKMGDDCRQDQISLQLIGLMKRILDAVGVPSYLYPYRVVTTGQDSGIIEVVPKSMSRNEIGKLVESNLAEFFVQTYGHPESVRFHRARDNFVKSVASYSVVSFVLNIKDRHNGNIMIDSDGHLVHIDFGFLFDTSPGGDMNFESSPFKLTTEMIQLIGKDVGGSSNLTSKSLAKALVDEESYIYFKTLVNRCYLAVRQYAREICILVELMLRSGLPCFKPKQTIANLAKRLAVGKTEIEAADFMRQRIHESRQNYRTVLYDIYQQVAEGIER